ncbi:MAG: CAP domain-containing protein [Actinobacteria bacterium]|nr:CAP domain-containing protein [Actinomycetota bacterium]
MTRLSLPRLAKPALVLVALSFALSACMSADQQTAFDLLNRDRNANRLGSLGDSQMLGDKAQNWAQYLAKTNVLKHSTLTAGITGCWRAIGENVGYGPSVSAVEKAYMNSAPHRANILNTSYDKVGTGVAWTGTRVYVVQVFLNAC